MNHRVDQNKLKNCKIKFRIFLITKFAVCNTILLISKYKLKILGILLHALVECFLDEYIFNYILIDSTLEVYAVVDNVCTYIVWKNVVSNSNFVYFKS